MSRTLLRKIVHIDQDKCDGCGQCVPSCAEGAIRIIDGKARLVGENLCDGLGACLGQCPRGAITVEERAAEPFDESAVQAHLASEQASRQAGPVRLAQAAHAAHGGCPGASLRTLAPGAPSAGPHRTPPQPPAGGPSRLGHWPIQLHLLPTAGPIWQQADLLLAADCVAFAMPDFHARYVGGHTLAIACPKLDDAGSYVEKLAAVFAANDVRSVTVAHMEVPCCHGLVRVAQAAIERSGRDIPLRTIVVSVGGEVKAGS